VTFATSGSAEDLVHYNRRYRGHMSIPMTEHHANVAMSEIENILKHVCVAAPGAPRPGEPPSNGVTRMNRSQAEALVIDLSRLSIPTGFCTQPIIDGNACTWNLNCHNCGSS
jgi:hypothetical protein